MKSRSTVRALRARRIVSYLRRTYPVPKSELHYRTPFQFVAAVILSAQCTDKNVNRVTKALWKKYSSLDSFANADPAVFEREIRSIPFFRNKAKAILSAARRIRDEHHGRVPESERELVALPGIGYKTAHVILGELFGRFDGIPTDTHVKRFAKRFDLTTHSDLEKISKDLERLIPKKDWKYVNNGFVLYGRYVCPARPHECQQHPLTTLWPPAAKRWVRAR